MQKRFLPKAILAISLISFLYSCTKLDTTVQGADLLTVDNINTFADTLEVITTQGTFDAATGVNYDSTVITKGDLHALGNANSTDFGKTDASIYVQFKPPFYPFYFGNAGDTVKNNLPVANLDSVVLLLSYRAVWGDSTSSAVPQTITISTISDPFFRDHPDSLFGLRYKPSNIDPVLTTVNITPQSLQNFSYFNRTGKVKDSVNNVLRVKLPTAFGAALYNQDSLITSTNNAFANDSTFRRKYNGFEIKTTTTNGNSLYYFSLLDAKSRLEFHYHKKSSTGVFDTLMAPFFVSPISNTFSNIKASSTANYIKRAYTGVSNVVNGPTTSGNAYLQTAPGTYVNVRVPGLDTFRNKMNKIVHRAFLQVDQNDAPNLSKYNAPSFLYMDLKDSIIPNRFKPVYFDLTSSLSYFPDATNLNAIYHPFPNSNVDPGTFGGAALTRVDGGVSFTRYEINTTRYIQHISSNNFYNYSFRLYAPMNYFYRQYFGSQFLIPYYNQLPAAGNVREGAGEEGNPIAKTKPRRMKMIVIYSLIK